MELKITDKNKGAIQYKVEKKNNMQKNENNAKKKVNRKKKK